MSEMPLHTWDLAPGQAMALQGELRERLVLAWDGRAIATVGGVDVHVKEGRSRAAIVVLSYPELDVLDAATAEGPVAFPYVPGLLAFREGPVVLMAWERLEHKPDLLLFDGQGIAHPRGIGLAAHVGLWLGRPSIGVAKTRLYGHHGEPGPMRGEGADLRDQRDPSRVIGCVLRTRTNVKPVYVSPGQLIDVPHADEFVLGCCTRYRLPEPIRWAHRVAGGASTGSVPTPRY
jgi:deoxyribonuclease V